MKHNRREFPKHVNNVKVTRKVVGEALAASPVIHFFGGRRRSSLWKEDVTSSSASPQLVKFLGHVLQLRFNGGEVFDLGVLMTSQ